VAECDNLRLNRAKSAEIIFTESQRQTSYILPPPIPDISRVTTVKIFGITITNHLSMGEHVRDVIGKCAQSLYALKLLRNHGMSDYSLWVVYKAVVLSKSLHASPAWQGFTSAEDKQCLEASVRRAVRSGLYAADDPLLSHWLQTWTTTYLQTYGTIRITHCANSYLAYLIKLITCKTYNLRPRSHSFSLTIKTDSRNCINRMLFKDIY